MPIIGLGCVVAGFGFLIVIITGSAVLRAAVSLANRIIGPVKTDDFGQWDDWDSDDEPSYVKSRRGGGEQAIPEPGLGKGMMIASTVVVWNVFVGFVLGIIAEELDPGVMDDEGPLAILALFTLPFGFAGMTLFLVAMLPTTFWRAAQVAFLHYFIVLVLFAIAGGAIFAAWKFSGG